MTNNIKWKDLKLMGMIGSGSFTDIYAAVWTTKNGEKNILAHKMRHIDIKKDLMPLSHIQHENILQFYGVTLDTMQKSYLIMEYAECGTFHNCIHGKVNLNNFRRIYNYFDILNWMLQCAKGITYLHQMEPYRIIQDLTTNNIFLTHNYRTLKICVFENTSSTNIAKVPNMSDTYRFGSLLWEVVTRRDPTRELTCIEAIEGDSHVLDMDELKLKTLKTLIELCWDADIAMRPSMKFIVFNLDILLQRNSSTSENVEWKKLELNKESIGSGAFGDVFKAVWNMNSGIKRNVAVKKLRNKISGINMEMEYLSIINHENMINIYGITKDDESKICIITEYADCGSLNDFLHVKENAPSVTFLGKLNWMLQSAKAIEYLHAMTPKLIHCDLKPKNLLLTNNFQILKLCILGTITNLQKNTTLDISTAAYIAPEVAARNTDENWQYDEKCNVYSFGIILWEVMAQKRPYCDLENYPSITDIYRTVVDGKRPSLEDVINYEGSENIKSLIEQCWHCDPSLRPTMKRVAFILGIDPDFHGSNILDVRALPLISNEDFFN